MFGYTSPFRFSKPSPTDHRAMGPSMTADLKHPGEGFPPVFIISLADASERRRLMADRLARAGLAFSVVDAVDGRRFNVNDQPAYNGAQRRLFFGRDLLGGEVGVLLSHRAALQGVVDQNLPCAVIFEDDVVFDEPFTDIVRALVRRPSGWELVRFFGDAKHERRQRRRICSLGQGYWLTRLATSPGEAHAYLVSQAGARKLLRRLRRTSTPIDTMMGQPWKTGVGVLTVHPGLARQDQALGTSISGQRFDKRPTTRGLVRLVLPVTKVALKLTENLLKRAFYFAALPGDLRRYLADTRSDLIR